MTDNLDEQREIALQRLEDNDITAFCLLMADDEVEQVSGATYTSFEPFASKHSLMMLGSLIDSIAETSNMSKSTVAATGLTFTEEQ